MRYLVRYLGSITLDLAVRNSPDPLWLTCFSEVDPFEAPLPRSSGLSNASGQKSSPVASWEESDESMLGLMGEVTEPYNR